MLIGVGGLRGQAMRGGEQGPEGPGLVLLRAPPPEPPHPVLYSGGHRGSGPRRTLLPGNSVGGGGSGMIPVCSTHWALYFCCYRVSSTADHQASDP